MELHFIKLYLPVTVPQLTLSSDAMQNLKMEIYLIKKIALIEFAEGSFADVADCSGMPVVYFHFYDLYYWKEF